MRRLLLPLFLLACDKSTNTPVASSYSTVFADSVMTLFDSLASIHRDHPDTALLRRLHPAADTILHVEGSTVQRLTGDSLFRQVLALHVPVQSMNQRFYNRSAYFLDPRNAILTASERVDWVDRGGSHTYEGLLTLVVSRQGKRWVIRSYRGT